MLNSSSAASVIPGFQAVVCWRQLSSNRFATSSCLPKLGKRVFPDDAVPADVAESVFDRTGGQPYLLQLYGWLLVERLNAAERKQAVLEDVPAIEEQVFDQAAMYFRDNLNKMPANVRTDLVAVARGETTALERRAQRWLRRRCLVTDDGELAIAVLGRWIREEWDG